MPFCRGFSKYLFKKRPVDDAVRVDLAFWVVLRSGYPFPSFRDQRRVEVTEACALGNLIVDERSHRLEFHGVCRCIGVGRELVDVLAGLFRMRERKLDALL